MSSAQFDAKAATGLFRTVTAASIDGRGRFPGAVSTARRHLRRHAAGVPAPAGAPDVESVRETGAPPARAAPEESDEHADEAVRDILAADVPDADALPTDEHTDAVAVTSPAGAIGAGTDDAAGSAVTADTDHTSEQTPVDRELVIRNVVEQHVRLAGAQGFVTSLGGFAVLPLALPANITGLAVLQTRMVATIAFLHGYDLADPRVRIGIVACLFGEDAVKELVRKERLPYGPYAIATSSDHNPELERKVATMLGTALTARVSGKRLGIAVSRRVPLLGGGVGAVTDAVATYKIGRYAQRELSALDDPHSLDGPDSSGSSGSSGSSDGPDGIDTLLPASAAVPAGPGATTPGSASHRDSTFPQSDTSSAE